MYEWFNPLSVNPTKWSNILKQFVSNLPTNWLSVFDHFVELAHEELIFLLLLFCRDTKVSLLMTKGMGMVYIVGLMADVSKETSRITKNQGLEYIHWPTVIDLR